MNDFDRPTRLTPQNTEAERAVLGSCLLDPNVISEVCDLLTSDDFFDPANHDVFDAIVSLREASRPVDLVTLTDELRNRGLYEQIGGQGYLGSLMDEVATSGSAVYYAGIVREKSLRRMLITAGGQVVNFGFDEGTATDDVLQKAEQTVFDVARGRQEGNFTPLSMATTDAMRTIGDKREKGVDAYLGLSTGYADLDAKMHGLQPGALIILAARPAMGKSALAMNIAVNVAKGVAAGARGQGYGGHQMSVLVFSLEMSAEQLATRLIAGESRVPLGKVFNGNLDTVEWTKINQATGVLSAVDLEIDDSSNLTIAQIRARVRRFASLRARTNAESTKHPLGLVVVDYLQLISGMRNYDSKVHEIGEISRGLKSIAREFNVPVLALSQLSRAVELRPDHRPQLSDLRDSGSIEQDADQVCFLYRPSYYQDEDKQNTLDPGERAGKKNDPTWALLDIAKNRSGPTGQVDLRFFREITRFDSYQEDI